MHARARSIAAPLFLVVLALASGCSRRTALVARTLPTAAVRPGAPIPAVSQRAERVDLRGQRVEVSTFGDRRRRVRLDDLSSLHLDPVTGSLEAISAGGRRWSFELDRRASLQLVEPDSGATAGVVLLIVGAVTALGVALGFLIASASSSFRLNLGFP